MPLIEQTVDARFLAPNQQAPNSSAPTGRLQRIVNGVVKQFDGPFIKTSQRDGFRQFPKKVVNPRDNFVETSDGFGAAPTLLSSLERELVVIADSSPYVLAENAEEWSHYPQVVRANTTRQRPVYTSNVQIKTPDSACVGNVVCYTWKQTDTSGTHSAWVMLKDLDGTVIALPRELTSDTHPIQLKVVSDGARFWVFVSGPTACLVRTIERDGTDSGSEIFATIYDPDLDHPAFWDVQFNECGVVWYGQTATVVHAFYSFTWSGGTITPTLHDLTADIGADFPPTRPFWIVDQHDFGNVYPALLSDGEIAQIFVVKMDSSYAVDYVQFVQSGFVFASVCQVSGCVDADLNVHVLRSDLGASPVFNLTKHTVMAPDLTLTDTTVNSVTVASRPFELDGRPTAIFYFTDGVQPTYFLHDILTDQVCGTWAHGTAAQDWQGSQGPGQPSNYDAYHVPSPYFETSGNGVAHCAVGFLAETFSRSVGTAQVGGSNKFDFVQVAKNVSCVGLADVEFGAAGRAVEYADELMIPGPQATAFTGALWSEDNFSLFPSAPTFSQTHSDAGNLELEATYDIVVVFESTDTRGNRLKSRPSDPVKLTLTGTNNIATITGPTLFETEGKTNVVISIYSNYPVTGGGMSTDHRKITDDLAPILNDKGSLTWSFNFNKTTEEIQVGEVLYTDTGLLPHDPCPAFSVGAVAGNRLFVAGYDGALWYSNEKIEGEPLTFNSDVLRVLMPTSDPIRGVETLDSNRILLLCERSIWEFDVSQLPGPDGLNGNVRAPTRLPFNNGCTGLSAVVKEGVIYTSSAGGVWIVTRGLENQEFSGPEYQKLIGVGLVGVATDDHQRTFFGLATAGDPWHSVVRDGVNGTWSEWSHPRKIVLVHSFQGQICYADEVSVHHQDGSATDVYQAETEVLAPIAQEVVTAPFHFGQIKGLKVVWKFILNGSMESPHSLIVKATYDTEDGIFDETWNVTPDPGQQYELAFEPKVIEITSIQISVEADYTGQDVVEKSFTLESISFEVGIDQHLARIPASRTPLSA